ncbi:glycerol-3-phosphate dehydrogenase (NAD(P)+) [Ruminococcaceae bacterium YRB3002]|nr:glycerol-3-phosphate dehydrogenase (NAD(P)+) [Ruminococcaceae bacterium YRB3002]
MSKVGVLGTGTWGMALARVLSDSGKHDVTCWSALPQEIDYFVATKRHPNLPGVPIPDEIKFTKDISEAVVGQDVVLFAVPSVYVRSTANKAAPFLEDGQVVADCAKGIEEGTMMFLTEVIEDEVGKVCPGKKLRLVALSGPSHAEEVAVDIPTSIVSASTDMEAAKTVQDVFMAGCLRVYTNSDIKGVEMCGALKNIIALAVGASRGMGYGDNTTAALITRGMAEISALGVAIGCDQQTFNGLAGIGDLIVTATSEHSRNNRCGIMIGKGIPVKKAIEKVGMVVEGINCLPAAMELAERYNVDLPIISAVDKVVNGGETPAAMATYLMGRDKAHEFVNN